MGLKLSSLEEQYHPNWALISGGFAVLLGIFTMTAMIFWRPKETREEVPVVQQAVPAKEDPDMRTMRFRLVREFDDHDPVILGTVLVRTKGRNQTIRSLMDHWANFQRGHPDSDTQFVDYLKKKGFEFEPQKDRVTDVVLD